MNSMSPIIAHITPDEFPVGLALFLGGLVVGSGIAVYFRYFRSHD